MATELDCKQCGACCIGHSSDGDYVPVTRLDRRRLPKKYLKKLAPLEHKDEDGAMHGLQLKQFGADTEACVALKGKLGKDVGCDMYAQRPAFCRSFERGSEECHARREEVLFYFMRRSRCPNQFR